MLYLKKLFSSTILGLTLGVFLAAYAVFAFTPPAVEPPGGNTPAPVNVGSDPQVKLGGLWVDSLGVSGGVVAVGRIDATGDVCSGTSCLAGLKSRMETLETEVSAIAAYSQPAYYAQSFYGPPPITCDGPEPSVHHRQRMREACLEYCDPWPFSFSCSPISSTNSAPGSAFSWSSCTGGGNRNARGENEGLCQLGSQSADEYGSGGWSNGTATCTCLAF